MCCKPTEKLDFTCTACPWYCIQLLTGRTASPSPTEMATLKQLRGGLAVGYVAEHQRQSPSNWNTRLPWTSFQPTLSTSSCNEILPLLLARGKMKERSFSSKMGRGQRREGRGGGGRVKSVPSNSWSLKAHTLWRTSLASWLWEKKFHKAA